MEISYYHCLNLNLTNFKFNSENFLWLEEKAEDFDLAQRVHKYNFGASPLPSLACSPCIWDLNMKLTLSASTKRTRANAPEMERMERLFLISCKTSIQ